MRHRLACRNENTGHPGSYVEIWEGTQVGLKWIRTSLKIHLAKNDADRLAAGEMAIVAIVGGAVGGIAGKIVQVCGAIVGALFKYHRNDDGSLDIHIYNGAATCGSPEVPVVVDPLTPTAVLQAWPCRGTITASPEHGAHQAIALQAASGQYVCAEGGGGGKIVANRTAADIWETFTLMELGGGKVALQANNGQYVCAEAGGGGEVVANRSAVGPWETFTLIDLGGGKVALQANNGKYVCAEGGGGREVVANRDAIGPWETFNLIGR